MSENVEESAYEISQKFIPKRMEYGEMVPIPRSERWGNIMYDINVAKQQPEINAQIAELRRLNAAARAAPSEVASPKEGNFKRNANGQLYRFTTRPTIVLNRGRQVTKKNHWTRVSKKFNYNMNIKNTLNREQRLGPRYTMARNSLWAELYPEEGRVRNRTRNRNRKQKTRKARR